jgi:type VI secretion system protein ImpA
MALTVEALLQPVSEDRPAGEDLSYDPERHQIEQAFESSEFDGSGDAAAEVDWCKTIRLIEQQFARTKDVWLPTYLCRAGARSGTLETVEVGAQVLAGLFEQYWDTVHPQLDELGLPGRKSPCDALASRKDFLGPLERVVLVAHPRLGAFTGVDLERFRTGAEAEQGYGLFRATLDELGDAVLVEAIGRLDRIEDGLRRADKVFTEAAGGEPSPNYAPAYALLAGLRQSLGGFLTQPAVEPGPDMDVAAADGGAPVPAARGQRMSGAVETRDDVVRALDAIADYYRRHEPSHPAQFLVQRAKAWISLDFMQLLRDIAPESLSEAKTLLTRRSSDDE